MDEEEIRLLIRQRNSMAVYLKNTRRCGCCLYRYSKEPCADCKINQSKWKWGGWRGTPTPEGNEVYASADKYFDGVK